MKTLCLLLLLLPLLVFGQPKTSTPTLSKIDSTGVSTKPKKKAIDDYVFKHQKDIVVLVKIAGKKTLVEVKNEQWPDDTEYIYNIIKDKTGKIIMIAQMPYSESGDWYLECKYYFDDKGKTFAFSKRETLFDGRIKGGMVGEELLKYYDADFKLIKQTFRLTDSNDKTLKRNKNEFDFRDDKYSTYKNVNDCLVAFNIKGK